MSHVEAVACDMNADFARAFTKACPHLDIVYDHFHIIKNFNEKVIMPVRIAEQKRLLQQGDKKAAATLKHSKYVLIANKATRLAKDEEAKQPPKEKAEKIFKKPVKKPKGNVEEYYQKLIKENDLFLKIDFIVTRNYYVRPFISDLCIILVSEIIWRSEQCVRYIRNAKMYLQTSLIS